MRFVQCLIIISLSIFSISYADKTCDKINEYIFDHLEQSGTLKQDAAGFVYIDLDDDYIYKLCDFIKDEGFDEPPYFYLPDGHGAHISVIYVKEAEKAKIGKLKETGNTIYFKVKGCQIIHPPSWQGVESCYVLTVEAPILDKIRKRYGLSKPKYGYHITIGIKRSAAQEDAA